MPSGLHHIPNGTGYDRSNVGHHQQHRACDGIVDVADGSCHNDHITGDASVATHDAPATVGLDLDRSHHDDAHGYHTAPARIGSPKPGW